MFNFQIILKLVERFPIIISLGAAVLAFTAAKMVVNEKLLSDVFKAGTNTSVMLSWGLTAIIVAGVLYFGNQKARNAKAAAARSNAADS